MKSEIPKTYNPKEVENNIYGLWLKSDFFNPDNLPGERKQPYTIMIPPPNVTGRLHMGHALNATVNDALIRWKRLKGYRTLWLPGTDHAGIATQVKVEKKLQKEGKTRFDLGREVFIKKVWEWKEEYGNIILEQLKKLGASLDWSRTRFTMDEGYSEAVKKVFLNYHEKGWIYKKERPINWCSQCKTSLSDLELEYIEEQGKLWYIKYPLADSSGFIIVATTRPETMLGDTAVAVNPKDERYRGLIGKNIVLPLVDKEIPIISDEMVDREFGTGAVKITPGHDMNDYRVGLANKLEMVKVIDEEGKMTDKAPVLYRGLSVKEARNMVVKNLEKINLIDKIEDLSHQVPVCYRCSKKIETLPSEQWFVKMGELAKMAKEEVKSGRIKFHPKRFEKTYFDWLDNIRDWCISRQLWWGHQIPVENSEDVLDTWFSSALWPFATLGWPEKTKDLEVFYPTDVLSTGRDIINLWVARMVFSGMEFMKEKPFSDVYIHPTVLTKDGRRMSKSLGTGIDPIDLIGKYGADATRFGLAWQLTGGQDIKFNEDTIMMGKKFCNKIWNAVRFVMLQNPDSDFKISKELQVSEADLTENDKKVLKALNETIKSVDSDLDNFLFGKATQSLYEFFWHDFCDKYIEQAKSQENKKNTRKVLSHVILISLKLLHPFIPFITEEIYQYLPIEDKKECLMVEEWPHSR